MGLSSSKSPLERRNTVLKRSQRKTIHSIKARTEKLILDISKFSGTEEDGKYKLFLTEIRHLNQELNNKIRELQPQVKNIHQATLAKLEEAEQTLQVKLQANREKLQKKKEEQPQQAREAAYEHSKVENQTAEATSQRSIEESRESSVLENSTDKRKTIELKFVQVMPEVSSEAERTYPELKSPGDKRKSILKMGVPVMPAAMLEEMTKKTNQASVHYDTKSDVQNSDGLLTKLGDTVDDLQQIECQIADFIGRKNGTQYNRIKDKLDNFLQEVTQMKTGDEFVVDQIQLCTNYIKSCLRFLDDKASENNKDELQDDVFLPEKNNNNSFNDDVQNKLQKLMKTTAI